MEPLASDFITEADGVFGKREIHMKEVDKILVCNYLNDAPLVSALENIEKYVDIELVQKILCNKLKLDDKLFLGDIIDSPLDVDRIDYLIRDSHHCKRSNFDWETFVSSCNVVDFGERKGSLVYEHPSSGDCVNITSARQFLYSDLYRHERKVAADEMICNAVYTLCEDYRLNASLKLELLKLTDADMLYLLRLFGNERIRELVERILTGNTYVPIFTTVIGPGNTDEYKRKLYELSSNVSNYWGYRGKTKIEKQFIDQLHDTLGAKISLNPTNPEVLLYLPPRVPPDETKNQSIRKEIQNYELEDALILAEDGKTIIKMKDLEGEKAATYHKRFQVCFFGDSRFYKFREEIESEFVSFIENLPLY